MWFYFTNIFIGHNFSPALHLAADVELVAVESNPLEVGAQVPPRLGLGARLPDTARNLHTNIFTL